MTEIQRINYQEKVFKKEGGEGPGDSIDCMRLRLSAAKGKKYVVGLSQVWSSWVVMKVALKNLIFVLSGHFHV